MESSSRKRRGFMKGKLIPFYRAAKPSSASTMQYTNTTTTTTTTNKVLKPSQSSPSPASIGFLHLQDYVVSGQLPNNKKVSFMLPNMVNKSEFLNGLACDEAVDSKAASYISSVQERFKLERLGSERVKSQDIL